MSSRPHPFTRKTGAKGGIVLREVFIGVQLPAQKYPPLMLCGGRVGHPYRMVQVGRATPLRAFLRHLRIFIWRAGVALRTGWHCCGQGERDARVRSIRIHCQGFAHSTTPGKHQGPSSTARAPKGGCHATEQSIPKATGIQMAV